MTPVFNDARHVAELVRSVQAQTYPRVEHLVIDDGSDDGGATRAALEEYAPTRWWSRENRGQYATMNEGFAEAAGEILITIASDDYFANPEAIEIAVDRFCADEKADLLLGVTVHVEEEGRRLPVQPFQQYPFWMMPYYPFVSHCSLFARRERIPARHLRFNESFRYLGDADWTVRMYRAGCRYRRLPTVVAAYRHHAAQATAIASASPVEGERRREERLRFDAAHSVSPLGKQLVGAYVTAQRRWRIAEEAWRGGGARALMERISEWRRRRDGARF